MSNWIKCSEHLPKLVSRNVMVTDGDGLWVVYWDLKGRQFIFDRGSVINESEGVFTHWMELPDPPKEEDGNNN